MASSIECMVALLECQTTAAVDPRFAQFVADLDRKVDASLERLGFRDTPKAREAMKFSIARIVQAKKIALQQLVQLAADDETALRDN